MDKNKALEAIKTANTVRFKRQVVVGTEMYKNATTGEIEEFTVIRKNIPGDYNFHKIWLQDLLNVLDSFGNCKIRVLSFMLSKMRNEDNTVSITQQYIAQSIGVSIPTISNTIKALIDANVLKKLMPSTYQFNPDIIVKGGSDKRNKILIEYNFEDSKKLDYKKPIEDEIEISVGEKNQDQ